MQPVVKDVVIEAVVVGYRCDQNAEDEAGGELRGKTRWPTNF
jgi:hypothetical protein